MVKIVVSEVDFRVLQTNDRTNRAMQLICITSVLGLSSVKVSAQPMPHHTNPKTHPGVSKLRTIYRCS